MKEKNIRHTPGPWRWQQFGREWKLVGAHSDVPIILDAQSSPTKSSQLRVRNIERCLMVPLVPEHPDAQLISAAPDLYDALEELVDLMEGVRIEGYKPDSFTCQPARAALAKVKGSQ